MEIFDGTRVPGNRFQQQCRRNFGYTDSIQDLVSVVESRRHFICQLRINQKFKINFYEQKFLRNFNFQNQTLTKTVEVALFASNSFLSRLAICSTRAGPLTVAKSFPAAPF